MKIKNYSRRSQTNDTDDLEYVWRSNPSQTPTSNFKYKRNYTYFHSYLPLSSSHSIPHISERMKSHIRRWSMLKIKNFSNRSQTNAIYHLQYILTCISSQTSTSNSKYNQRYGHLAFSIFLYFYELIGQYLIYAYNKFSSSTEAVNEKLFISLTDKWYIWLVLYLKMEIKPNIDL